MFCALESWKYIYTSVERIDEFRHYLMHVSVQLAVNTPWLLPLSDLGSALRPTPLGHTDGAAGWIGPKCGSRREP